MTTTPFSPTTPHISDRIALGGVTRDSCPTPNAFLRGCFTMRPDRSFSTRSTRIPEYYVTRTERGILAARATEIVARAANDQALRIVELGAGSADKTRLLLTAAVERQDTVFYEPVDVSASALGGSPDAD